MPYTDLRQFLHVLGKKGKVHRISRQVDKDWEIAAVCRNLFDTVPDSKRTALLFENISGFDMPVLVNALGGSRQIYALGLEIGVENVNKCWGQALQRQLFPRYVDDGPCKENILRGEDVDLTKLPVPVWVADHDPGPYITAPLVCAKDPDTGITNLGLCRMQVKGLQKTGVNVSGDQILAQLQKNADRGVSTPCAAVIGADPVMGMISAAKLPGGVEAYAVGGGLRGEPIHLVQCETVDLAVPATAEIVIEGEIPPDREWVKPFGEYTGYIGAPGCHPYINVTCISYRNNPIFQTFFSQMPPSEISCIQQAAREWTLFNHLHSLGLPVNDVHLPESGGSSGFIIISVNKLQYPGQVSQIMNAAWGLGSGLGKFTIVVDDDIDIRDSFSLEWALSFRVQPKRDCWIVRDLPAQAMDPSQASPISYQHDPSRKTGSVFAIDATLKHEYPSLSRPPQEHLDFVDKNWSKYGFV